MLNLQGDFFSKHKLTILFLCPHLHISQNYELFCVHIAKKEVGHNPVTRPACQLIRKITFYCCIVSYSTQIQS